MDEPPDHGEGPREHPDQRGPPGRADRRVHRPEHDVRAVGLRARDGARLREQAGAATLRRLRVRTQPRLTVAGRSPLRRATRTARWTSCGLRRSRRGSEPGWGLAEWRRPRPLARSHTPAGWRQLRDGTPLLGGAGCTRRAPRGQLAVLCSSLFAGVCAAAPLAGGDAVPPSPSPRLAARSPGCWGPARRAAAPEAKRVPIPVFFTFSTRRRHFAGRSLFFPTLSAVHCAAGG